jgi:hypothetical protein
MKRLILALLLVLPGICQAISVYYVSYRFAGADKTAYEAFLVRNDANGGFIRVRYTDAKQQECLVNMAFTEEYREGKEYLLFKGASPVFMKGTGSYNPDYFWFKKDPSASKYNSYSVSSPGTDGTTSNGTISSFKLLDLGKLSEDFVAKFFDAEENFYQNLFAETETFDYNNEVQPTLHLVLAADTWDKSIGTSCQAEQDRVYNYFEEIANQSGMKFDPTMIHDGAFTKQNVTNALNGLQPGVNDAVVFYYSGHGFRFNNDTDPYPRIDIRTNDFADIQNNSLSLSYIYNTLKGKKARLNLVLGDCCNSFIGLPRFVTGGNTNMDRSLNTLSGSNCKQLFLQSKGNIIATAATKGQYALCDNGPDGGGLFTKAFLNALDYQLSTFNAKPTWTALMSATKNQTAVYSENSSCLADVCRHDPIFYVDNAEKPVTPTPNPVTTAAPKASIEKIWVEYNVTENELQGLRIHTKFNIYNYKGIGGNCIAYFYTNDGTPLKDYNNRYYTSTGFVSANTKFEPAYENTLFNDLTIFIPYDELHVANGSHDLKFRVELHRGDVTDGYTLSASDWQYFNFKK